MVTETSVRVMTVVRESVWYVILRWEKILKRVKNAVVGSCE